MHVLRRGNNWKVNKSTILADADYSISHPDGRKKELGKVQLPELISILKMSPAKIDEYCEQKVA